MAKLWIYSSIFLASFKTLQGADWKNVGRDIKKELEIFTILQLLLAQDNTLQEMSYFAIIPNSLPICSESVTLYIWGIIKKGIFPEILKKKANVVPVNNKEGKALIKNYCCIGLFSVFNKIFKRIIYNSLFHYFLSNNIYKQLLIRTLLLMREVFFLTKVLWCWGWIAFTTLKLSLKWWTKNCFKWSNIWVEKN